MIEVRELASLDGALKPTSLSVRRGEILGVAGLVGSGKAELGIWRSAARSRAPAGRRQRA